MNIYESPENMNAIFLIWGFICMMLGWLTGAALLNERVARLKQELDEWRAHAIKIDQDHK